MLLGQISWLDIFVFLTFLAFHLLRETGLYNVFACVVQALPFLVLELPTQLIRERFFTEEAYQQPFTRRSTLFQDIIIRCVRYAFTNIPSRIGRVFFSRGVALPFLRFRMMRHGYGRNLRRCPTWREVYLSKENVKGLWIVDDKDKKPDVFIYYCHGGGFAMGSPYFYLEFLLAWVGTLKESGFKNPAIFALEYALAPDEVFPHQLGETINGYSYVLQRAGSPHKVVVAGDSAGGTLILSLLLYLGNECPEKKPALATLISPWTDLVSKSNRNTPSDYVDSHSLHVYGRQYAASEPIWNPLVSPGSCLDRAWWRKGMPPLGVRFYYGSEEVFRENIRKLAKRLAKVGTVVCHEDDSVHAWPVAAVFLGRSAEERARGLRVMSWDIAEVFLSMIED
ncbi:hypothetical protein RUND412_006973 [Rhizina undulata]